MLFFVLLIYFFTIRWRESSAGAAAWPTGVCVLPPLHGHTAPGLGLCLLFFVIVGLVAQGDPQLLEFPHSLAVDVQPRLCGRGGRVVPEDVAHVVEQTAHRHQELRLVPLILAFQNVLGVWMTIRIRHPEAVPGCFCIFVNTVACEVQLPQQVAGPGMILVSCMAEILRRSSCVLLHGLTRQIFLSQTIGSIAIPVSSCSLQPLEAIINITHLRIVREI